jgi:Tfp pilus assembly protein PilN
MALREMQLDFMHPAGRASRFGPLLLVVGLVAVLAALSYQRQVNRELVVREARLAELRGMANRTLPALSEKESDTPEVRSEVQKANAVLQQLNVPWGELFVAVESAEGADVALLAVQPDPRSHSVVIGGVARNLAAVFAYMDRLEHTKRLRDIVLSSHEVKSKEPGQPVEFALNATWDEVRR